MGVPCHKFCRHLIAVGVVEGAVLQSACHVDTAAAVSTTQTCRTHRERSRERSTASSEEAVLHGQLRPTPNTSTSSLSDYRLFIAPVVTWSQFCGAARTLKVSPGDWFRACDSVCVRVIRYNVLLSFYWNYTTLFGIKTCKLSCYEKKEKACGKMKLGLIYVGF